MKGYIKRLLREGLLDEARRYEDNFNVFMHKLLNKYDYEKIYLSFRDSMNVSKINVKNKYNTPTGIYTYKLSDYFSKKDEWEIGDFIGNKLKFPFASGYPFLHFYILKDDANILSKLTNKGVFDNYVLKIKGLYNNDKSIQDKCDNWLSGDYLEYNDSNDYICYYFWKFLYFEILGGERSEEHDNAIGNTNVRFTNLCNKLGIDGFEDNGQGFIHINEKRQTVFFKPNLFKAIEIFSAAGISKSWDYREDGSSIEINDNTIDKIINKRGLNDGLRILRNYINNKIKDEDKLLKTYDIILKNEIGIYFIQDCLNHIKKSNIPIKFVDILIKNGLGNKLYGISDFLEKLKEDDPLFQYIMSIPNIKYYLGIDNVVNYNIEHGIGVEFIYDYLNGVDGILKHNTIIKLINNANDGEKMVRFLTPYVFKLKTSSEIMHIGMSLNGELGKQFFDLVKNNNK